MAGRLERVGQPFVLYKKEKETYKIPCDIEIICHTVVLIRRGCSSTVAIANAMSVDFK
jgi:hypothetical protein